ncbi:MAG: hypothetical protein SPL89_07485 [Clostridia bacterium]|nr:hypothetical protein [Clostridia bacterium]
MLLVIILRVWGFISIMKHYSKPTLEITKLAADRAFAAGSPSYTQPGTETIDGVPVTVYEIKSFESNSQQN